MGQHLGVLGQVADQLDHEANQLVAFVLVYRVREAVLDGRDLRLVDEVLMELRLRGHVTQSDTRRLDQVDLVLLCAVKEMNQWLDLLFLGL